MKVREWMSPDPVTVSPDTTVAEARGLLESEGIRHLPVVTGGQLLGIVSDRDIGISDAALRAAVRDNSIDELLDDHRPVEAIMSDSPHVISADEGVADAARMMVSRRISALPVVEERALVGIITSVDCLLASLDETASR